MKNARELCVQALVRVERTKAYSNLTLDQLLEQEGKNRNKDPLWRAESAFASTLFYGVLERKLTLDSCIEKYAVKGFAGMAGEVLAILRISFYQLLFMPNIPESAVVNEAVKLTRTFRRPGASGFVNGVLQFTVIILSKWAVVLLMPAPFSKPGGSWYDRGNHFAKEGQLCFTPSCGTGTARS